MSQFPRSFLPSTTANVTMQYPFRLPSYRSAHLKRFHPYPRVRRPLDSLMNVADFGSEIDARHTTVEPVELPPVIVEEGDGDVSFLDLTLSSEEHSPEKGRIRVRLTTFVIDLALAMRNRYRILRANATSKRQ